MTNNQIKIIDTQVLKNMNLPTKAVNWFNRNIKSLTRGQLSNVEGDIENLFRFIRVLLAEGTFDEGGKIISMGNAKYTYDQNSVLLRIEYSDENGVVNKTRSIEVNEDGNPIKIITVGTHYNEETIHYTYDVDGIMNGVIEQDGTGLEFVLSTYMNKSNEMCRLIDVYDRIGNLLETERYDFEGNLVTCHNEHGDLTREINYIREDDKLIVKENGKVILTMTK